MFQTLIVIASIVVLAGAILSSSLVSARNAFHQIVAAKTQTAMTDATSQFTAWAQNIIENQGGTEQNWAGAVNPIIPTKSMCATAGPCQFYETTTWVVTGATSGKPAQQSAGQSVSTVQNMAPAVDEQRLSATISVAISDATGRHVYGGRTELVTARLFNASPFIAITGARDVNSIAGKVSLSEGDSGGIDSSYYGALQVPAPITKAPSAYTNTVIRTTIDCKNTTGFDQTNPIAKSDQGNGHIVDLRQGGSRSWAFQMPCVPTFGVPSAPSGTVNYQIPSGNVYAIGSSNKNNSWTKGDDGSSFPR